MPLADAYDRLARDRAVAIIGAAHRRITARIVEVHAVDGEPGKIAGLVDRRRPYGWARARTALNAIAASPVSIAKPTVATGLIDDLAR